MRALVLAISIPSKHRYPAIELAINGLPDAIRQPAYGKHTRAISGVGNKASARPTAGPAARIVRGPSAASRTSSAARTIASTHQPALMGSHQWASQYDDTLFLVGCFPLPIIIRPVWGRPVIAGKPALIRSFLLSI